MKVENSKKLMYNNRGLKNKISDTFRNEHRKLRKYLRKFTVFYCLLLACIANYTDVFLH